MSWPKQSNAFLVTKKTTSLDSPLSMFKYHSYVTTNMAACSLLNSTWWFTIYYLHTIVKMFLSLYTTDRVLTVSHSF